MYCRRYAYPRTDSRYKKKAYYAVNNSPENQVWAKDEWIEYLEITNPNTKPPTGKWVRKPNPPCNRLPFSDWKQDFYFRKELHMTTEDIQTLPITERVFYVSLLEEIWLRDKKVIDDMKNNQKNKDE